MSKSICLLRAPIVSIILLLYLQPGVAQVTTGAISGTVHDETGAILPGTTITIKNLDTGISRTLVTDDRGAYYAPNLAPGNYEVQAVLTGFRTGVRSGIKLTVGREAVVDFALKVGELTEKIVVIGEAPLVETTSSSLSGLVDDKKIRDLPLNGRSYIQLSLLEPGVVASPTAGNRPASERTGLKFSIAGARPNQNSYLLDGTDIANFSNNPPTGIAGITMGVETLREFQILTNTYSAEFGRSAGGVINAVTRSGTNEFHGTLFEFHRNSALDAKNFFDRPDKPIPPFKRNQFGGVFSGPIIRDRTFYLLSYEGLRERLGVTTVATVPTASARRGILPTGRVPVDPKVVPYLNLYPLPNGRDFGDGRAELLGFVSRPTDENFFVVKIDHNFSESDSMFVRYSFDDAFVKTPQPVPLFRFDFKSRQQFLTIEEKKIFSPSFLNVFRFAFNRTLDTDLFTPLISIPAELSFIPGQKLGSLNIGGITSIGGNVTDAKNATNLFQYIDNINYTRGRHLLKAGFDFRRFHVNSFWLIRTGGSYLFADLRSFLANRPLRFEGALPEANDAQKGWRQNLVGMYIQDDFKMKPHFSLNLGLRYEFITAPSERFGKIANVRNPLTDKEPTVGEPLFKNPSLKNFAPRFGFAWDPFKDGKMAVRGGFGIFYDQVLPKFYFLVNSSPPFFVQGFLINPPFPNPLEAGLTAFDLTRVRLDAIEFDIQTPYRIQYNLNVQREILPDTVFTVGYVGSRGVNLVRNKEANSPVPIKLENGRKFFPPSVRRRNPALGAIRLRSSDVNSFYNALVLGLTRKFSRGLQLQVSYTFSRSIDESASVVGVDDFSSEFGSAPDPDDRKSDRGLSPFHVKHNFVLNYTYDLPFGSGQKFGSGLNGLAGKMVQGWQINGIITLSSGVPFSVENGFDRIGNLARDAVGGRPDLKPGRSNNPTRGFKTPDQWFDPTAFQLQPERTFGNLGRNTVIGPSFANFDFSVVKNTSISEDKTVQFRVEFFNLFNHPNFSIPSVRRIFTDASGVPLSNAGRITETVNTSRQVQFALKFLF